MLSRNSRGAILGALGVVMVGSIIPCTVAEAAVSSFVVDNLRYSVKTDGTVAFCGWTVAIPNLVIPATVTYNGVDYKVTEVLAYAFSGNSIITSVVIPDTVTVLGAGAFNNCTKLTSVVIGNGVKAISEFAFNNCTSLTSVDFGSSVEKIGGSSFADTKLTTIVLPNTIAVVDMNAFNTVTNATIPYDLFYDLTAFKAGALFTKVEPSSARTNYFWNDSILYTRRVDGTLTVLKTKVDSGKDISIPEFVNGIAVTAVETGAFKDITTVFNLTFPASVKSIGSNAIDTCSINNLIFKGNTDRSFGNSAFHLSPIAYLELNEGITKLTNGMLVGCFADKLIIPSTITSVDSNTFYSSSTATRIKSIKIGIAPEKIIGLSLGSTGTVYTGHCLVTFTDANYNLLSQWLVPKSTSAVGYQEPPELGTKAFLNWGDSLYNVITDMTYHATYNETSTGTSETGTGTLLSTPEIDINKLVAVNRDSDVFMSLATQEAGLTYHYTLDGTLPTTSSSTITDTADIPAPDSDLKQRVTVKVAGFDSNGVLATNIVSKVITYSAKEGIPNAKTHTVVFKDRYWNTISTQTGVVDGASLESISPSVDSMQIAGYTFTGWNATSPTVDSDLIIRAQYEKNSVNALDTNYIQVVNNGSASLSTVTVEGRTEGEIINIYKSLTDTTPVTGVVSADGTVKIDIQLSDDSGFLYMDTNLAHDKVKVSYLSSSEQAQRSLAILASRVTVTGSDTLAVQGMSSGEVVNVYDADNTLVGTATQADTSTASTSGFSMATLDASPEVTTEVNPVLSVKLDRSITPENLYVARVSPGLLESQQTELNKVTVGNELVSSDKSAVSSTGTGSTASTSAKEALTSLEDALKGYTYSSGTTSSDILDAIKGAVGSNTTVGISNFTNDGKGNVAFTLSATVGTESATSGETGNYVVGGTGTGTSTSTGTNSLDVAYKLIKVYLDNFKASNTTNEETIKGILTSIVDNTGISVSVDNWSLNSSTTAGDGSLSFGVTLNDSSKTSNYAFSGTIDKIHTTSSGGSSGHSSGGSSSGGSGGSSGTTDTTPTTTPKPVTEGTRAVDNTSSTTISGSIATLSGGTASNSQNVSSTNGATGTSTEIKDSTGKIIGKTINVTNGGSVSVNMGSDATAFKNIYKYEPIADRFIKVPVNSVMVNGNFVDLSATAGSTYYVAEAELDKSVVLSQGWNTINNQIYRVEGMSLKTGWFTENSKWYFLNETLGKREENNWVLKEGVWYYLGKDGEMQSDWLKWKDNWYYLNPWSGAMAKGWKQLGESWYFLNESGAMVTGWKVVNGDWYYFNTDGTMAKDTTVNGYKIDVVGHLAS